MIGAIVNFAAILAGSFMGLLLNKRFPKSMGETIMKGLALCVLFIGIKGAFSGENILLLILSIAIGTVIGEGLDLEGKINQLGLYLERKVGKEGENSISRGFVSTSLLFCVGAMAIVGSMQSGLSGDHSTLFAKSLIDGICAAILSAAMGAGVLFSALLVLIYQGGIVLLSQFIQPFLTQSVINEISCVGSVLIMGLAFNMLELTKLKIMNYLPAVLVPFFWNLLTLLFT